MNFFQLFREVANNRLQDFQQGSLYGGDIPNHYMFEQSFLWND